jgi:ATP-dependent Zn protease
VIFSPAARARRSRRKANCHFVSNRIVGGIGVVIFFVRQMPRGGNMLLSFGKSKATLLPSSQKKVTFN